MPTLTINIPSKQYKKNRVVARREGFKTPTEWARFLVEKNMGFQNSPRLKPSRIISEMKNTGLYKKHFLDESRYHGLTSVVSIKTLRGRNSTSSTGLSR